MTSESMLLASRSRLIVGAVTAFAVAAMLFAPFQTNAIYLKNPDKWEGKYEGWFSEGEGWDDTFDSCGDTEQYGDLFVRLVKVKHDGTIVEAKVKFSDDDRYLDATGEIFKKDGVRRIRLNYDNAGFDAGATYRIRGKLTDKRKIRGTYEHTDYGCNWGGSARAKHI